MLICVQCDHRLKPDTMLLTSNSIYLFVNNNYKQTPSDMKMSSNPYVIVSTEKYCLLTSNTMWSKYSLTVCGSTVNRIWDHAFNGTFSDVQKTLWLFNVSPILIYVATTKRTVEFADFKTRNSKQCGSNVNTEVRRGDTSCDIAMYLNADVDPPASIYWPEK